MTDAISLPTTVSGTPSGVTVTGAANAAAALLDSSDASYIQLTNAAASVKLNIAAPTTPSPSADHRVAWIRWRIRANKVDTGSPEIDQHPEIKCVLDGQCGRAVSGRPWDRIGMQTTTRISWTSITSTRVRGDFSADGLPIAVAPTNMTLLITRDEDDNDWEPRIYKVEVLTAYVRRPVVSVVKPQGTLTETAHPEVRWENTRLNRIGGPQVRYEVKVFDDANYGAGGFTPTAGTVDLSSGVVASPLVRHEFDDPLGDDTYRTYVRVAQRFNGANWWSEWGWKGFVVAPTRPTTPTFTLVADSNNARMQIRCTRIAPTANTTHYQIHRSRNGSDWEAVRTSLGHGLTAHSGSPTSVYDYEGRNGETTYYRVRAVRVASSDPLPEPNEPLTGSWAVFSAWATTQSAAWTDARWWFVHPYDSTLNVARDVRSQPGRSRGARAEVFQPLGRDEALVISDTYEPWSGELIVRNSSDAERNAWDDLVAEGLPILIQPPAVVSINDFDRMWVHVSEHSRERMVDSGSFAITWDRVAWQQVSRPVAAQPDNPVIAAATETSTSAASAESP